MSGTSVYPTRVMLHAHYVILCDLFSQQEMNSYGMVGGIEKRQTLIVISGNDVLEFTEWNVPSTLQGWF